MLKWEMRDKLPPNLKTTVVVGMSLSPMKDGDLGKPAKKVLERSAKWVMKSWSSRMLLSNRFMVKKLNLSLAEAERDYVRGLGVPFKKVIIPRSPRNPWIRNTKRESEFAVQFVENMDVTGRKSILVIANFIHMKRVVATFRNTLVGSDVELYWISTGSDKDFGPGFVQKRFRHPLFFLCYEMVALTYSRLRGIA